MSCQLPQPFANGTISISSEPVVTTRPLSSQRRPRIRPRLSQSAQVQRFAFDYNQPSPDENCFEEYLPGQTVLVWGMSEKTSKYWRPATVLECVSRGPQQALESVYKVMFLNYSAAGKKVEISTGTGNIRALPKSFCDGAGKLPRMPIVHSCQDFVFAAIPLKDQASHFKFVPAMYIQKLADDSHSIVILSGKHEGERYTTKFVHGYK